MTVLHLRVRGPVSMWAHSEEPADVEEVCVYVCVHVGVCVYMCVCMERRVSLERCVCVK
jgi:hypothetical protein